ncbi:P-loop containing nucleoside triphosphate hydrolase protein [Neohortaea acidophila]|uniref:RNA helicase n=1 Tax=Neohortaea acidophila TaxID=245834 RepID=A0A6A6PGF5_9PEZI|nr:P-loop containing nucleoside triphosphate hydrolase protein [Neohortaea acidophila]KAF2478866.1 P-loop containing nucleoside triphosphate hydrolase protein [Neohortaea acidophila]
MARFVPRDRKKGKLGSKPKPAQTDSNAAEIVPVSKEEKARREALKQELRAQQPEKISSQKRKRLEKYIDTKLKKDATANLIRQLGDQKFDTSLLHSSKSLGRRHETKREKRDRDAAELSFFGGESEVTEDRLDRSSSPSSSESDIVDGQGTDPHRIPAVKPLHAPSGFGSGLKRPLDVDADGQPVLVKRRRRKQHTAIPAMSQVLPIAENSDEDDEDEWHGFSEDDDHSVDADEQITDDSASEEDEDSEDLATSSNGEQSDHDKPVRISAFKAWADTQMNTAVGFTPSAKPADDDAHAIIRANFTPRAPSPDPLLDSIASAQQNSSIRPAATLTIQREEDVQTARLALPVVQDEQRIIETIHANTVTILCGSTGSGKTTQVPQMLLENGYGSLIGDSSPAKDLQSRGMIGITQPRRIAATSAAERVAYELGPTYRDRVAHQVRYDTTVSKKTAIKFMTDGVLLREIQMDFSLSKYSCIMIDEAHERSVNTDLLIGLLSRIVPQRAELALEQPEKYCPLKLIIMSATLRVDDFLSNERLFPTVKPPVLEVEGRQYSVTEHFSRKTKRDYVEEMIDKVARGHRKLPPGAMLVFLTGQQEITFVAKKLNERLNRSSSGGFDLSNGTDDYEDGYEKADDRDGFVENEDDDAHDENSGSEADIKVDETFEDEFAVEQLEADHKQPKGALRPHILPLYAALPVAEQQQVFEPPPEGTRMIVLATNVAETSLTIPGIRYVFDCGRSKEKKYDHRSGIQTFEVDWISKASADQRKGRAGRTGPGGHVWRLYSSAVFERYFEEHTVPEILRTPLESVVLQLKAFSIENVAKAFPFATAPEQLQLEKAEALLQNLGAVKGAQMSETGKQILKFPVDPRYGKILVLARNNGLLQHAIALTAGLAVGDLYIPQAQTNEEDDTAAVNTQHQAYGRAQALLSQWDDRSDAVKMLRSVALHAEHYSNGAAEAREFCRNNWLREKSMVEVQQLRKQLHAIARAQSNGALADHPLVPTAPKGKELQRLNQLVAAGFIDSVAIRADLLKSDGVSAGRKPKRAIEVAYRTLKPSISDAGIDRTASPAEREVQRSVFIHPSSVLAKLSPSEMPSYIVYSHLSKAVAATVEGKQKKTRMHPLTPIGPKALAVLAEESPLLEIGKPIGKIEDVGYLQRQCWVGVAIRAPGSVGMGWPLTEWKVVQKRDQRGEWVAERVVARM